jgi:predicted RNA-binding protein associated with RNAse of E/G family
MHWHALLDRLGEDEHGVWLGAPLGTVWRRGSEPPTVDLPPHVVLVPHQNWWVATFNAAPAVFDVYVDLSTVSEWRGDLVTMVDLDLDVVRHRNGGTAELLDEDEFAEHRVAFGYPDLVVGAATTTAEKLMAQVIRDEPFTSAHQPWLAQVS